MESNGSASYDVSVDPVSGSSVAVQNEKLGIAIESNDSVDQGSVVWAKTAGQIWWPAEIMGESSSLDDSIHQGIGHVLVQFYGSNQIAWVDPAIDASRFDNCFEERRCYSMDEFQEALRLCNSSDELDQPDQSSDKWASSTSSRIEEEDAERGRGNQKFTLMNCHFLLNRRGKFGSFGSCGPSASRLRSALLSSSSLCRIWFPFTTAMAKNHF